MSKSSREYIAVARAIRGVHTAFLNPSSSLSTNPGDQIIRSDVPVKGTLMLPAPTSLFTFHSHSIGPTKGRSRQISSS